MKDNTKITNKVIKFGNFRWVVSGAIFAFIIALCFVSPKSSGDDVFNDHFVAFEDQLSAELDLTLSTRGAGDDDAHASLRLIREGMEYYNNKEYEKAIPIFQEYLEDHKDASDYNQIKFYLAVSFLGQGEAHRSISMFEQLTSVSEASIQEDAKWYLSLAYTRTGDVDKARTQLEELASSSDKYRSKVEKILNPTKTKVAFR